jgi:alcohol dehydrogenase class IV
MFKNPLNTLKKDPIEIPKDSLIQSNHLPQDSAKFKQAIAQAKEVILGGGSKVDAAKTIYPLLENESKEVIHLAFIEGCGLTEKGATTYRYNIIRNNTKNK